MAQGTTNYPTALDTARENPSNMDSSEAAMLAVQAKLGVQRVASADGAIALAAGTVVVTKTGSAAALTLAAPTAAMNGYRISVVAATDFAHVVTATGLILDGTTGAHNTGTTAAFTGSGFTLEAYNLKWYVVANVASTFA